MLSYVFFGFQKMIIFLSSYRQLLVSSQVQRHNGQRDAAAPLTERCHS